MKISIITVCRNAGKELEKTISSVKEQTYLNIEYIFVDGLSDDRETIEIINRNKNKFDVLISEKDNGIYDAMNKGITAANGDFILFINAGDRLVDSFAIDAVVKLIESKNVMMYFVDVVWVDQIKKVVRSGIPDINYISDFYNSNFTHSGTIYSRNCFEEYGKFDLNYKILADFEMNLRLLVKNNLPFTVLNTLVSVFYTGGISTSSNGQELRNHEMNILREKYDLHPKESKSGFLSGKLKKKSLTKLNRIF